MAPHLSRRTVMAAGAASLFVGRPAAASIARMQTPAINMALLQRARAALETHRSAIPAPDRIAVIDFGLASRVPRLHLIDLERSTLRSVLVAHGRGSDPAYTGWLIRFSNTAGSDATSAGSYVTGTAYVGEHGHSMRLEGLDATNSNAQARGIVMHSAWYVNEALAVSSGKIGRSDGCFAVAPSALAAVLSHLGSGRFVYADRIGTGLRNPA